MAHPREALPPMDLLLLHEPVSDSGGAADGGTLTRPGHILVDDDPLNGRLLTEEPRAPRAANRGATGSER
jgi:hypothetical protein